jgi:hypothetical protein
VRWYLRYSLSLRDVEELFAERPLILIIPSSRKRARARAPADKPMREAGGAATAHNIKFGGPGDDVNATVTTSNGTILYWAQLRLVFWGRDWASAAAPVAMTTVITDVQSIVAGPYLTGLQQYAVSRVWVDRAIDLTDEDPPNNPFNGSGVLTQNDAEARIGQLISDGKVPEPDEDTTPAIYVVFLPSSVAGSTLVLPTNVLGDHTRLLQLDRDDFWFSDVPVAWVGNDGTRDFISVNFSHDSRVPHGPIRRRLAGRTHQPFQLARDCRRLRVDIPAQRRAGVLILVAG